MLNGSNYQIVGFGNVCKIVELSTPKKRKVVSDAS